MLYGRHMVGGYMHAADPSRLSLCSPGRPVSALKGDMRLILQQQAPSLRAY